MFNYTAVATALPYSIHLYPVEKMANSLCLIIQLWQQLYHTPYICTQLRRWPIPCVYLSSCRNSSNILHTSIPSWKDGQYCVFYFPVAATALAYSTHPSIVEKMANTWCLIIQLWQQLYHTPSSVPSWEDGHYLVFNYPVVVTALPNSIHLYPVEKMANTMCLIIQLW